MEDRNVPLGIQFWSIREDQKRDFAGAVAAVREIGYEAAELYGYGNLEADKGIEAVQDAGLRVISVHVSIDRLRNDREAVIAESKALGCTNVVCPFLPDDTYGSTENCRKVGKEFNEIGAAFCEVEIDFYYHNHWWELDELEGQFIFDRVFSAADPHNLKMELDVCFLKKMGLDPASYITSHRERIGLIHLKDGVVGKGETEFAEGDVDFQSVFSAANKIPNLRAYIMEHQHYHADQFAVVRKGFEILKGWGL
jgi:sugar phosphate isomerase/epimerase